MITSYILILCVSTWMLVAGLSQAAMRVTKLLGLFASATPALCVMLPIIGFLVVVAAAPAMLVAALLLLGVQVAAGERLETILVRFGVPALAALLAASSVHFPAIANVPSAAMMGGAGLVLLAVVMGAEYAPASLGELAIGWAAALLPLLVAPFMDAPAYIALDVALVLSGLLAALMVFALSTTVSAMRAPIAVIIGWLVIESAAAGAWVPAAMSMMAYGGSIAYGLMRGPDQARLHAL